MGQRPDGRPENPCLGLLHPGDYHSPAELEVTWPTANPNHAQAHGHEGETRGKGLDDIIAFDEAIRFVAVLDLTGKMVASASRRGYVSLEPPEKTSDVFMKIAIGTGLGEGEIRYHGKVRTVIVMREKVTLIVFLAPGRSFLISADPQFQIAKVELLGQALDKLSVV